MNRQYRFTFLINEAEAKVLDALARRLQRTRSDAVRWVVCETFREFNALGNVNQDHETQSEKADGVTLRPKSVLHHEHIKVTTNHLEEDALDATSR